VDCVDEYLRTRPSEWGSMVNKLRDRGLMLIVVLLEVFG